MALFPRTPKLESRNCPEIVPVGVPGLWTLITPDCRVRSQQGLNQSCIPRRDLSNAMSHFQFGGREEVDSRLLVVGSQIASLTPGPSFAHNLGWRCPNGQCKAIFDIYVSRPFQWHQERLNERCFGPCCRALNIRESRRTPNPQLWKCWVSPPHLAKVGLRHFRCNPTRVEVVLEDVGVGENGAKARATQEYSPTHSKAKLWNKHLWIRISCWGNGIKFEFG